MRILYLTPSFSTPDQPGMSRYYQFAKHWVKQGHDVHILTSHIDHLSNHPHKKHSTNVEGIHITRAASLNIGIPGILQRTLLYGSMTLACALSSLSLPRPDIVIGSSPPPSFGLLARMLAKKYKVPFVFERRDIWPRALLASGQLKPGLLANAMNKLEALNTKKANGVVFVTKGDQKESRSQLNLSSNSIFIPHGADDWMQTSPLIKSPRSNTFTCTFAGAFHPYNQLHQILECADSLKSNKNLRFQLIGDGDQKKILLKQTHQRNLCNVSILPHMSKKKVFEYLSHADLCLLTGGSAPHYKSWLPNKVFDYLTSGTPTIAIADGELANLIDNAGGIAIPSKNASTLSNAICKLASLSPLQRSSMGSKSRQFAIQRYSRTDQAQKFLDFITTLVP